MSASAACSTPAPAAASASKPARASRRPASRCSDPQEVIAGVLDIVRTGDGPAAVAQVGERPALLSGECIKACDYGVNPRFLLAMARVAMAEGRERAARAASRGHADCSAAWPGRRPRSRACSSTRRRWSGSGSGPASVRSAEREPPDFVFYTGCNVLKTPHIALLALDIMDALGISYRVMGGPSHCCGIMQLSAGDAEMSGRMGSSTVEKLSHSKVRPGAVLVPELLRPVHRDDAADAREAGAAPGRSR